MVLLSIIAIAPTMKVLTLTVIKALAVFISSSCD